MKYPNSGSLSPLDSKFRKTAKAPNATGYLDLGEDLIDYINQEHRAGRDVRLDLAAWTKDGEKGKWYSLNVKKRFTKEEGVNKPTRRPAPVEDDSDIPF